MNKEVLEEFFNELRDLANNSQQYNSYTGDTAYDYGLESGHMAAGEAIEDLMRHYGIWD